MSCHGHQLLQSPILFLRCYSHCSRIGSQIIKSGLLYVKPKVLLSRDKDNDYSLKLGCDYTVLFISQGVLEGVKKRGRKASWPKH